MQLSNQCLNKLEAKMVIVCCDRLLLSHSANFVKFTFTVVKILLVRLFCAPSSAAPGGNCALLPPSPNCATGCKRMVNCPKRDSQNDRSESHPRLLCIDITQPSVLMSYDSHTAKMSSLLFSAIFLASFVSFVC